MTLRPARKIWRTSARPSTTSTTSGSSRPRQGRLHLVGELVDDVVQANLDALGLGRAPRLRVDLGVEADDDGVRRRREQDVVVGDVAGALAQDVDPHLVGLDLLERVADGAQRALNVGLEDDAQLLGLAGLDLAIQVLERGAAGLLRAWHWRGAPRSSSGRSSRRRRRAGCHPRRAPRRGPGSRPAMTGRPW